MAFAAAIGPMISGIASMAGAMASASAMNEQAAAQEEMAAWNAARERETAAYKQGEGAVKSARKKREYDEKAAAARAIGAQGGLDTTTGSLLTNEMEFAKLSRADEQIEMYKAETEKNAHLNKASIEEYEGKIKADSARSQASASLLSGFAGMVKGFGGAFG